MGCWARPVLISHQYHILLNVLTPAMRDECIVILLSNEWNKAQREWAERMFIETSTVKSHVHHIFTKLGIATRSELAATASRRPP